MRWWRLAFGSGLLVWVLGAAYHRARQRGRDLGLAVVIVGIAIVLFSAGALVPRPPVTDLVAALLVVGAVGLLGVAMAVLLWRGFRE